MDKGICSDKWQDNSKHFKAWLQEHLHCECPFL